MTRTPDNGGTAFPTLPTYDGEGYAEQSANGMSLRDWFAGQALAAIVSKMDLHGWNSETGVNHKGVDTHECHLIMGEIARGAYGYADAMLAERSKP